MFYLSIKHSTDSWVAEKLSFIDNSLMGDVLCVLSNAIAGPIHTLLLPLHGRSLPSEHTGGRRLQTGAHVLTWPWETNWYLLVCSPRLMREGLAQGLLLQSLELLRLVFFLTCFCWGLLGTCLSLLSAVQDGLMHGSAAQGCRLRAAFGCPCTAGLPWKTEPLT